MYRKEWNTKTILKNGTQQIYVCRGLVGNYVEEVCFIIIHLQITSNNMYLEKNCSAYIVFRNC